MNYPLLDFALQPARRLLSTLFLLLLPLLGWGQAAYYSIANGSGNNVATLAATNSASGVTAGALSKTGGLTTSSSTNNFRATGWSTTAALGGYITFTLTPATGVTLNLTSLVYGVGSSGTGPTTYQWRSSLDNYGSALATVTPGTAPAGTPLSLPAAFSGLTSAVTFRLYGYSASASGGTGGLAGDLTVNGTATSTTPTGPTLTASTTPATSPTALTGLTYVIGSGPSAAQSFSLTGSNLTAGTITITGSTNYEVSADNSTFGTTATIANTAGGTLAATPVYVRLKTGLAAGTYNNETIAVTGGGTTAATNVTVSGSVTAAPSPTLTLSSGTLTAFNTTTGMSSTAQSYTLTGTNLTADVTVTPPAGYEVSQTSATTGFAGDNTAITISQADAANGILIYVRLTGTTAGTYGTSGAPLTIAHASTGATTVTKAVFGTVTTPTPTITVAPATALSFATTTGTPSVEQNYTVSAANLTANLTVTAPAGYEISLASGTYTGTGGNTLTLTPTSGTVGNTFIYVRLTGAATGSPSGSISNASTGATTRTIAVSGTVTAPVAPALVTYSLTSVSGNAASAPSTAKDANISAAANLTRGSGLTTSNVAGSTNLYGGNGWGALTSLADAQAGNKYFAFAFTPALGTLANVSSIVGNAYRNSAAPATVELLYSFNSDFSNPVSLGSQAVTATGTPGATFTFVPGSTTLKDVPFTVYFRLYGYASTGSGNFYFLNNGTTPGLVVNGTTAASTQPVIATGTTTPAAVCGGSDVTVSYTTGGPAATGAYFVQLSDASGSFATPLDLATTGSTSTSVTATIPATVASGTAYRVRVANTNSPYYTSASAVFTVVSNPAATIMPTAPQTINAGTAGTTLTVTETPAGVSRQWLFATTAGGPYTAISTATGLTYTPTFAAAGIYYVVAQSTFAACGPVTSNEVAVTVTVPALLAAPSALSGFVTNVGAASAAQTYVLTGNGVLAPVTVSAPTGVEVSLDGLAFAASVQATAANVNAGQTIYVRLLGTATGSVSGNVTNTVGTVTVSVAVSGNVLVQPGLLLAEDDFDYTGSLSANGWSGSATSMTIAGNSTIPTYPQGILATGGTSYQARILGNSGSSLTRLVTTPSGATTLYAATVINVSNVANVPGDDYLFSFQTTSGGTSYRGQVTIASTGGNTATSFTFRLRAAGSSTAVTVPTQFNINTEYLLVLKVENSAATGNSDRFSLYVLPSGTNLSQEPSTPLLTTNGVNIFGTIGGFNIRQQENNNPNLSMDNFRYATGWGAAVGNITYNSPTATINPGSYYNVTASNGQVTQAGAVLVENQLALPDSRLSLNGQRLTLAGTITGTGTLSGSTASNLVVLGTGALGTLSFTPGAQTLSDLILNRTTLGTATLGSPLAVSGTLALTNGTLTTTATNVLTLTTNATLSGGSANSFINGPLRRTTGAVSSATLVGFPIGKGTAYRPLTLTINGQTSNTIYQAEQFNQSGGTTIDASLQRVSQVRYFSVTPYSATTPTVVEQPTGFAGTITLRFGADDQVTDPAAASFVVAKRDNSTATWAGIGGSGSGTGSAGTLTSGSFSSFSDFALASTDPDVTINPLGATATPLPVQLTRFAAARAAAGVQVAWATASEKNSDYFVVERSLDGRIFASVARVAAQGTTAQAHAYTHLDGAAPAALLYYRLRQVDLDGTTTYSPVVTVAATDAAAAELTLVPNPARESVSFETVAPTAYTVRNTLGQLVRSGTTVAGPNRLVVQELPAGVYFLELHGTTGRVVRKFVKE